ncbi:hypothetical protein [Corynebacterium amycolatum]|nr:hypothetical protein [Corynebacterium amycolatum]UVE00396.1 hypothetical protein NU639_09800 [Corynebacterium amycolatum]
MDYSTAPSCSAAIESPIHAPNLKLEIGDCTSDEDEKKQND